jgi:ATP-dependent RNA helicase DDX5/DBP2
VAALTPTQVEDRRRALSIRVFPDTECPNPVETFLQASFPRYLLDLLAAHSFEIPTPIQKQAWPVVMRRLDMIGLAETGSGKTLAYLLPALVHVNAQPVPQPGDGPIALILAPTRELAAQIHEESVRFGHPCGVRTACVVGGLPKGAQIKALRKAPEVVVATPGRLNDLLSARRTKLVQCTYLVLDEADRMLDMGFEPQIRRIVEKDNMPVKGKVRFKITYPNLLLLYLWP